MAFGRAQSFVAGTPKNGVQFMVRVPARAHKGNDPPGRRVVCESKIERGATAVTGSRAGPTSQ